MKRTIGGLLAGCALVAAAACGAGDEQPYGPPPEWRTADGSVTPEQKIELDAAWEEVWRAHMERVQRAGDGAAACEIDSDYMYGLRVPEGLQAYDTACLADAAAARE